jgi:hypothetical protein
MQPSKSQASTLIPTPNRRVNIPDVSDSLFTSSVFWFGKVDPTSNYADVRLYYYNEDLVVVVNVIDRLVWYDTTPSRSDLPDWDAVSFYLDMDGYAGSVPSENAYLIQSQQNFKTSSRWNGTTWAYNPISFIADTAWRGNGPNDMIDDKGWQVTFRIPFISLGLSGPPPEGTVWDIAVRLHDRDNQSGSAIPDQVWPTGMAANSPATWGRMHFGIPSTNRPPFLPKQEITIRDDLNGASVPDAHVGGHTICGENVDHWTGWGNANYAGYNQINIQNQWDVSDWPCFSKYYVTFPLDSIPAGKNILSATLTMFLFGNAGGGGWGEPPDSYIHVFTVGENWNEATLTWNNAPLALENIAGTWVYPMDYSQPYNPYQWDVSNAAIQAYASGEPLRLALYSADGERHTGKYFWSSDSNEWSEVVRPTLKIQLGIPCTTLNLECNFTTIYTPLIIR